MRHYNEKTERSATSDTLLTDRANQGPFSGPGVMPRLADRANQGPFSGPDVMPRLAGTLIDTEHDQELYNEEAGAEGDGSDSEPMAAGLSVSLQGTPLEAPDAAAAS
ncbi:hypothetical protein ACOMHN_048921 [Nucella lapillus]